MKNEQTKYDYMWVSGCSPEEIFHAIKDDGKDNIEAIKIIRETCALSVREAKGLLMNYYGEDQDTDPHTAAIQHALDFAVLAHKHQSRKLDGDLGVPYVIHPLDVVRELAIFGINRKDHVDVWQAALLHDVIEDTHVAEGTIAEMFGDKVLSIIKELTFRSRREGESGKEYQKEKRDHLASYSDKSVEALVIKVAHRS